MKYCFLRTSRLFSPILFSHHYSLVFFLEKEKVIYYSSLNNCKFFPFQCIGNGLLLHNIANGKKEHSLI